MYLEAFGLREEPFGVTPDPRFLYLSDSHRETLRLLASGLERNRGFLALVAEPGMGKTTLAYKLLDELGDSTRSLFLFQTQCDSRELFRYLLSGLGADGRDGDIVAMHEKLNEILARESLAGRRFVLVIDEAQNLSDAVLETVRLLSDFETPHAKLIQIVLVGQPQLARKLSNPELTQLRQRLAVVAQLGPLSSAETLQYVQHRLEVAGYQGAPLFAVSALERIAELSKGIPRVINNICSNALDIAHAVGRPKIDSAIVEEAAALLDLDLSSKKRPWLMRDGSAPAAKMDGATVPVASTISKAAEAPATQPAAQPSACEVTVQPQPASRDTAAPKPVAAPAREPQPVPEPKPVAREKPAETAPAVLPVQKPAMPPVPARAEASRQAFISRPLIPKAVSATALAAVPAPSRADEPRQFMPELVVVGTERRTIGAVVATILLVAALGVAGWYTFYPFDGYDSIVVNDGPSSDAPHAVVSATSQDAGVAAKNSAATNASGTATAPSDSSAASAISNDNRPMNAITIVVKPNQTLQQICMQYVGRYDDDLLRQIRELNPGISDFDHIEVGQEIWIPMSSHPAANGASATGAHARAAKAAKP